MKRRYQLLAFLFGLVLIILLAAPYFVPVPPLEHVESEIAWGGVESRFLTIRFPGTDGIALHYLDKGQGDIPVVMLHSETGDLYEWEPVMDNLTPHARVIAYDRPPYGLSEHTVPERWADVNPYTTAAAVDMFYTLLDTLLIDRVILVASAGASKVAIEAALAHPDRVAALVLVAPDPSAGSPSFASVFGNIPQVDRLGPLLVRGRAEAQPVALRKLLADPSALDQAMLDNLTLTYRVQNWDRAVWEALKADTPVDFTGRLSGLTMPVVILAGDSDPVVPLATQQNLAAQIPTARIDVMRATGHLPHLEHPGEISKTLELVLRATTP